MNILEPKRLAWLAALLFPLAAAAQSYPDKPIHLIVPFPPGGVADIIARPIAEKLTQSLGQPVIVENRGGATGTIGAAFVAHAAPDGYTLLLGTTNEMAMSPTLYATLPYDPTKDFAPVSIVAQFPNVLVVSPRVQAGKLADLTALAKAKPKSLTFASSGQGSTNHLTAELYQTEAGVQITHIPYKGGGPALVDLTGGHVDAMFATLPSAVTLIKAGKLHALAVTGSKRTAALPDVPTMGESGLPGVMVSTWNGVIAPAGTPPAVIDKLAQALKQATEDPGIQQKFALVGAETTYTPPQAFAGIIRDDYARWSAVIKKAGIKAD
ncbi:tripartite tricarboxylate transporter substrate binding protein [Bordetella sp. LUAb4]|uniref:Bug family tripartite tricarboxylate transporter substrate binding protein n=1 Tax=Bordetella sp. LUAb4 TaxID=2843195 RepID=UPI001E441B77|nr:tripartite tricarboxylate transporter substrate binding protein [Bordetella sp. LUAb4]